MLGTDFGLQLHTPSVQGQPQDETGPIDKNKDFTEVFLKASNKVF